MTSLLLSRLFRQLDALETSAVEMAEMCYANGLFECEKFYDAKASGIRDARQELERIIKNEDSEEEHRPI